MTKVLFDESMPRLVEALRLALGDPFVEQGVIVRDVTGRLSFVSAHPGVSDEVRATAVALVNDALGEYAREGRALAFGTDIGAQSLLQDPSGIPIRVGDIECKLVDRRIIGTGWLETPNETAIAPPRIVFASIKGGVGRSTALAVTASDLARRNKNVLVIDLDLEAPGIGDLLLDPERMPRFGVVDYLVENGIGGISDAFLDNFIGDSTLTTGEGGRVQVVPALGSRATELPENVLPKLARAMIEDISSEGNTVSISHQITEMINRLAAYVECDVVLIDSRAGLAEIAAPAVLGLGATILLFGTAQSQTINGYRSLFAGLKLLARRDKAHGRDADWRLRLKAVHAKASLDETVLARHRDNLYDLFSEELYDEDRGLDALNDVSFDIDDVDAPHTPLTIPFNQNFVDFDPTRNSSQLTHTFYEQTFRSFLDGIDGIINASNEQNSLGEVPA